MQGPRKLRSGGRPSGLIPDKTPAGKARKLDRNRPAPRPADQTLPFPHPLNPTSWSIPKTAAGISLNFYILTTQERTEGSANPSLPNTSAGASGTYQERLCRGGIRDTVITDTGIDTSLRRNGKSFRWLGRLCIPHVTTSFGIESMS